MTVRIQNLTKSYNEKTILKSLNLLLKKDEIATIMGKSGSGKTTLLLCILGFVKHDSGKISFDGKDISSLPIEQRQIAYVPQDYGLFPHLSVQDNIAFGLKVRRMPPDECYKRVKELLKAVELPIGFAHRNVTELSGGEKQRVALARALAIHPRLFLLDEPLSAVDAETKRSVGKQLRTIIKKLHIPAIIISHDSTDAKTVGDVIYHLKAGKLEKTS